MSLVDLFAQGMEHEDRLRQQRYQNELLHFEMQQKERERQADLAQRTMQETMADIANGTPADAAVARAKALYKAHGIDASPSIKPRDPNHPEGGGYEFHGFLPNQDEPIIADPRAQRQRAAAIRAAGVATVMGENPEAQGLLPPIQERALQTPQGQAFMGRMGGIAGQAAAGMAGMAPGVLLAGGPNGPRTIQEASAPVAGGQLAGLAAIAGMGAGAVGGSQVQAAGMAGQELAPDDAVTAVAHQAALAGDEETLKLMQRRAEALGRYSSAKTIQELKNAGTKAVADTRAKSALEIWLEKAKAKLAGGGGGPSAKDVAQAGVLAGLHEKSLESLETNIQRTSNDLEEAQRPKVIAGPDLRPVVVPPNPAAIGMLNTRLVQLQNERDALREKAKEAKDLFGVEVKKRLERRPGKAPHGTTPSAPPPELQVVKIKAKTRVEFTGGPNKGRKATLLPGEPFDPATMKTIE